MTDDKETCMLVLELRETSSTIPRKRSRKQTGAIEYGEFKIQEQSTVHSIMTRVWISTINPIPFEHRV